MKKIKKAIVNFFKSDKWYYKHIMDWRTREEYGIEYIEGGLKVYLRLVFVFLVIVALMIAASKIGAHYA